MLRALTVAGALLIASSASAQTPSILEDATVEAVTDAWPFDAGIIGTYVRLGVVHEDERADVYALQLSHDDRPPDAGMICSIEAHLGRIVGGSVVGETVPTGDVMIASRIVCDGQEYLPHG